MDPAARSNDEHPAWAASDPLKKGANSGLDDRCGVIVA